MGVTPFHIFHSITVDRLSLVSEVAHFKQRLLSWVEPGVCGISVRSYEFLDEMLLLSMGRLVALRLVTKCGSKKKFLQAINIQFLPCAFQTPHYKLEFIYEIEIDYCLENLVVISHTDHIAFLIAEDKPKNLAKILALPLQKAPRNRVTQWDFPNPTGINFANPNPTVTVNIAQCFVGVVKRIKL